GLLQAACPRPPRPEQETNPPQSFFQTPLPTFGKRRTPPRSAEGAAPILPPARDAACRPPAEGRARIRRTATPPRPPRKRTGRRRSPPGGSPSPASPPTGSNRGGSG